METAEADALDRADMQRLAAGHGPALNELMERHASRVFHFLCRMVGDEEDAGDLAQETFARVFRACQSYQPEHRVSTWLYTIAGNLARDHLRRRARRPNVSLEGAMLAGGHSLGEALPADRPAPDQAAEARERAEAVRRAVQALPADLREAVVLCEWEELSQAEAAQLLHTTAKAVESRLYRARKKLREQLEAWL